MYGCIYEHERLNRLGWLEPNRGRGFIVTVLYNRKKKKACGTAVSVVARRRTTARAGDQNKLTASLRLNKTRLSPPTVIFTLSPSPHHSLPSWLAVPHFVQCPLTTLTTLQVLLPTDPAHSSSRNLKPTHLIPPSPFLKSSKVRAVHMTKKR